MKKDKIVITAGDLQPDHRLVVDFGHTALSSDVEVKSLAVDPANPNVPANIVMQEPKIALEYPSEFVSNALSVDPNELLGTTVHTVSSYEPHTNGPADIKVELP